jgi:hypothetical protein
MESKKIKKLEKREERKVEELWYENSDASILSELGRLTYRF